MTQGFVPVVEPWDEVVPAVAVDWLDQIAVVVDQRRLTEDRVALGIPLDFVVDTVDLRTF